MKLFLRLTFLALVALSTASCAENRSSLFIQGLLKPSPPSCEVSFSGTSTVFFRGTLDVAFRLNYQGLILVGNQLAARGDPETLRTEVNRVPLEGAEVLLTDAQGEIENGFFSVAAGGFAEVSSGTTPGYGAIQATLIPDIVGNALADDLIAQGLGARKEVVSTIRVFGRTLGGIDVESAEFTFPIDVCYGCLVGFPLEALDTDPGTGVQTCQANAESAGEFPCFFGQDSRIDCRACVAQQPDVCLVP